MGKTITFTMNAKDVKTVMAAAEILKGTLTPATEPVIAVIEEASAKPTKKAAVKKATPAKVATKKSNRKTAKISSNYRITVPYKMLDRVGLRGAKVKILKKKNAANAFYMTAAGTRYDKNQFTAVRTVELPYSGSYQVHVGRLINTNNLKQVNVNVVKNMIEVTI